jgi:hypothetical protein
MNQAVYDELRRTAQAQEVIYYSLLNKRCGLGLDFDKRSDSRKLGQILGEISRGEHSQQHPLLSVVAVYKETHMPANSFFRLARELGVLKVGESNDKFFLRHLRETHEHWSRNPNK